MSPWRATATDWRRTASRSPLIANAWGARLSVITGGIGCLLATAWVAAKTPALRSYRRDDRQTQPEWSEFICNEDTSHVQIGDQNYKLSPEGFLMPVRRGQKPPDLKHFQ